MPMETIYLMKEEDLKWYGFWSMVWLNGLSNLLLYHRDSEATVTLSQNFPTYRV